jgi:nucleoside-diphosphate kinase
MVERTFVMVKPDGLQRGLVNKVMKKFEQRGYKLVGIKLVRPPREVFELHYHHLEGRDFYARMLDYLTAGPVCVMVWEGNNAVAAGKQILGKTYAHEWTPGTLRGDFGVHVERSICHASDTVENAQVEVALWFPEGVVEWTLGVADWLTPLDPWVP